MKLRTLWLATFVAAGVVVLIAGHGAPSAQPFARRAFRPLPPPARVFEVTAFGTQLAPISMSGSARSIYILTASGTLVVVDAQDFRVQWQGSIQRLDFTPRTLVAGGAGQLLVLGGPGQRPLALHFGIRSGKPSPSVTLLAPTPDPSRALWQSGCFIGPERVMISSADVAQPLLVFDSVGSLQQRVDLPWIEYARAHPLQRQAALASHHETGTCVLALAAGNGMAAFDRTGVKWIATYEEPYRTLGVIVTTRIVRHDQRVVESRLERGPAAATDIAAAADRVYVAFAGASADAGYLVDTYSIADGSYRGSLRFPEPVRRIAASGGRLFVASFSGGVPVIRAYDLPGR